MSQTVTDDDRRNTVAQARPLVWSAENYTMKITLFYCRRVYSVRCWM